MTDSLCGYPGDRNEALVTYLYDGDSDAAARAVFDAHLATWDPDSLDRSLPWASEIYGLAERVGNTELAMAAHSWRISLLLESGDMATVDQEIETFTANARRLFGLE